MEPRAHQSAIEEDREEDQSKRYLEGFYCPITAELFQSPAMAEDGHTYELSAFRRWTNRKMTSPLTNLRLSSAATQDNYLIKKIMAEYEEKIVPELKQLQVVQLQVQAQAGELSDLRARLRQKEVECSQLKRVEEAFFEQKLTLDSLVRREHELQRKLEVQEEKMRSLANSQAASSSRSSCTFFSSRACGPTLLSEVREEVNNRCFPASNAMQDLLRAIKQGRASDVKQILSTGINVSFRYGQERVTPLILAVRLYLTSPLPAKEIIKALYSAGASLDQADSEGDSPLHWAAYYGLGWPLNFLLEKGANPLLKNRVNQTPSQRLIKQSNFSSLMSNCLLRAEAAALARQDRAGEVVLGRGLSYHQRRP